MLLPRRRPPLLATLAALVVSVGALSIIMGCCCCVPSDEGDDPGLEYRFEPRADDGPFPAPEPLTCAPGDAALARPEWTHDGSSGRLLGRQLTIVAFVQPEVGPRWTPDKIAQAKGAVEVAHDFLEAQATRYGQQLDMEAVYYLEDAPYSAPDIPSDGSRSTAFRRDTKEDVLAQLAGKKRKLTWRNQLAKKHQADGVHLLIFNAADGRAFAWSETGVNTDWTVLYDEGSEGSLDEMAPVIAHELLHIYGAHDLYTEPEAMKMLHGVLDRKTSSDVERRWPEALMLGTRREPKIRQYISPYTAWLVGWSECTEPYFASYRDGQLSPDW